MTTIIKFRCSFWSQKDYIVTSFCILNMVQCVRQSKEFTEMNRLLIISLIVIRHYGKEVVNFEREYQSLPPGTKTFVMSQLAYMRDQILGKNENTQFLGQNFTVLYGPPLTKYTYFNQLCPCSYKPQVKIQLTSLLKN